MKITSLSLVGFKRMSLGGHTSFTIKPTQDIQLILGTNGSGKSSLIGELTPIPANPSDYTKEGSKTITIEQRGKNYTLKSWFSPTQKHSFICDGEELNTGGTVTVQKELCKRIFSVDTDIHEMMSGLQNFTTMSAPRRREWFTKLSDVNYDYALGVYKRLKEKSRDISGALKMAKKRLVFETERVITDAETEKLQNEVDCMLRELDVLQSHRAPVETPANVLQQKLNTDLTTLEELSKRLLRTRLVAPYAVKPYCMDVRDDWGDIVKPVFTSLKDIESFVNDLRQDVLIMESVLSKLVENHTKLKESVDVLVRTGEEGVRSLLEHSTALRTTRTDLMGKLILGIEINDPQAAQASLTAIAPMLTEILTQLPSNEDKRLSQAALVAVQEKIAQNHQHERVINNRISAVTAKRNHMLSHKDSAGVVCPKCRHSWNALYSEEIDVELQTEVALLEAGASQASKEKESLLSTISEIESYGTQYRDYVRTARSTPALAGFWNMIEDSHYLVKSPQVIVSKLDALGHDIGVELKIKELDAQIDDIVQLIASAEKVGDTSLGETRTNLDNVTLEIENLTFKIFKKREEHQTYRQYAAVMAEAEKLGAQIQALLTESEKTNKDMVESVRRETLNHCIRQIQSSLARKEEALSSVSVQKAIIADVERQIIELEIADTASTQLVNSLSPTDGLIAEGLLGFIRSFVGQMNVIVKKIWSYPMVIKDCGISSDHGAELDYKFPLKVQNRTEDVSDISKGSSGMQEIINLAFKIVAMKYLGLAQSPLFLDEFAARFDPTHKAAATELIKNLMHQQPFTQLFMVSHDYGQYGALPNVEVCVICPNNITVPSTYNQHVTMS